MQQRSKILLNEPKEKYDYSVIYVAYHLTLRQFLKCIWYHTVYFWLAFMNSYWGRTIQKQWMWQCFLKNIHLIGHFKICTGKKPYQCRKCAKAFLMKCDLKYHLKTHSGDKLHYCSHCGKVFFFQRKVNLQNIYKYILGRNHISAANVPRLFW